MLCLVALLSCLQIPLESDFQFQRGVFSVQGAAAFDSLAIVRPVRRLPAGERTITSSYGSGKVSVVIDEAKVLHSVGALPETVRIVTPFRGDPKQVSQLKPGRSYLLVSCTDDGEALRLPLPNYVDMRGAVIPAEMRYARIERGDPVEIMGLAAFETRASTLVTDNLKPVDRLMANVANCLLDADLESVQRVCAFVVGVRYPPSSQGARASGQGGALSSAVPEDAPFVAIMRSAAARLSPSNAARVYNILAWWEVPGAGADLYRTVRSSAADANLGVVAGDTFFSGVGLGRESIYGGAQTADERQARYLELIDLALAAKSPAVQRLLFNNIGKVRDIGRQRRILALAAASNDEFARMLLEILARSYEDTEHVPKMEKVDRSWKWTNKAALFKYWRERLGVGRELAWVLRSGGTSAAPGPP